MGTFGLIVQAESLKELHADKFIAFAMRHNRVKQRDIWDLYWLDIQGIEIDSTLLRGKLDDRTIPFADFSDSLERRIAGLPSGFPDFNAELSRFLPSVLAIRVLEQPGYWEALTGSLKKRAEKILSEFPRA
jgi:hypothetical protein